MSSARLKEFWALQCYGRELANLVAHPQYHCRASAFVKLVHAACALGPPGKADTARNQHPMPARSPMCMCVWPGRGGQAVVLRGILYGLEIAVKVMLPKDQDKDKGDNNNPENQDPAAKPRHNNQHQAGAAAAAGAEADPAEGPDEMAAEMELRQVSWTLGRARVPGVARAVSSRCAGVGRLACVHFTTKQMIGSRSRAGPLRAGQQPPTALLTPSPDLLGESAP